MIRSPQPSGLPGLVVLFVLLAAFACSLPVAAAAGTVIPLAGKTAKAPALPENLTPDEVRSLLSRLSDAEVRALLLQQLDKVATEEEAAADQKAFVASYSEVLQQIRERSAVILAAAPRLGSIGSLIVERLTEGRSDSFLWTLLLFVLIVFGAGVAGEWLFRRLFTRLGEGPVGGAQTTIDRLCILSMRLIADLLAITVFGLVASIVFFLLYQGHAYTREAIAAVFWSVILIRVIAALGRFALAPAAPSLRVPPLGNDAAGKIYRRLLLLSGSIVIAWFFGQVLHAYGIDEALDDLVAMILILAVLSLFLVFIWLDRKAVAAAILRGSEEEERAPGRVRQLVAADWHIFATSFIVGIWALSTLQRLATGKQAGVQIILSLVVLVAIPAVDWILRAAISALLRVSAPPAAPVRAIDAAGGTAAEAHEAAAETFAVARHAYAARRRYRDVLVQNLRIVLGVGGTILLLQIWEINVQAITAKGVGTRLAGALFDITITLILASAAWGILKTAINQAIPEEGEGAEAGEAGDMGGAGGSRLQTLLPLLGKFLLIALAVIVTMIILSELGVDIGPLLAGAGVVGLAIGFGAQTLVKDILSGVFFLVDDAFRVGEYIDVGDVRGTVEHISVRSLRLRHHRGPLHTIPFGEIRHLTNYSRDWAIMKLELRVPFDTDLEKVRKLIKKVGQELMQHPEHGKHFLQPVKSQGVNRMDDSAFIVRVKFMAKPGEQFTLRREVFRRIQEVFAENDIHFAPRRVIVDTQGLSPEAAAAAAASAAAMSEGGEGEGTGGAGAGPGS